MLVTHSPQTDSLQSTVPFATPRVVFISPYETPANSLPRTASFSYDSSIKGTISYEGASINRMATRRERVGVPNRRSAFYDAEGMPQRPLPVAAIRGVLPSIPSSHSSTLEAREAYLESHRASFDRRPTHEASSVSTSASGSTISETRAQMLDPTSLLPQLTQRVTYTSNTIPLELRGETSSGVQLRQRSRASRYTSFGNTSGIKTRSDDLSTGSASDGSFWLGVKDKVRLAASGRVRVVFEALPI